MSQKKAQQTVREIREELETRLNIILPWYKDCIVCDETLQNIRRDVDSLFREVMERHGIKDPPCLLRTRFDEFGYIVVDVIDRKLN